MGAFWRVCCQLALGERAELLVAGFALLVRFAVGLHGYSGEATPPRFGDYEAQRHWMEITLHTPVREWYTETPANQLDYWGLDYPPLTAYQSFLHGLVLHFWDPQAVALGTSRGYESPRSKMLMRWTVISADILVFFPAAFAFVTVYYARRPRGERLWALAVVLLQPGLILIDHGHFQFNGISLGLAMAAAAAILAQREVLGSVLFCLSLNHKQMSMYLAPAFFAHLLGRCLQRRRPLLSVVRLGAAVLATFAVCWAPFLTPPQGALQVLARLAPLSRGLYEDHVANFWCATSVAIKWKQLFSVPVLARMALGATIFAALPAMVHQIFWPSAKGFLLAMLNSSFAFYMFAFQVHEKSILLPLLPATMLALEEPLLLRCFAPVALFSMFPLLQRDGLVLAYFALLLLFYLVSMHPRGKILRSKRDENEWMEKLLLGMMYTSLLGGACLHILATIVPPPTRYPYIHQALMTTFGFTHLVPLFACTYWQQWMLRCTKYSVLQKTTID